MVTLDPEVNNAQKKQLVADFNKNDIVKIIKDAISAGVIEIPSGGSEVIANPTLAGTESELVGIQVDDTKYKVGEKITTISFNPTQVVYDDENYKATYKYVGGTEVDNLTRRYKDIKITLWLPSAQVYLTTKALASAKANNQSTSFVLQLVGGHVLDSIEMDIASVGTTHTINITFNFLSTVYDQMKLLIPSSVLVLQATLYPAL